MCNKAERKKNATSDQPYDWNWRSETAESDCSRYSDSETFFNPKSTKKANNKIYVRRISENVLFKLYRIENRKIEKKGWQTV